MGALHVVCPSAHDAHATYMHAQVALHVSLDALAVVSSAPVGVSAC